MQTLFFIPGTNIISVTLLQVPVLSSRHPMTAQQMHQHLHSTALEWSITSVTVDGHALGSSYVLNKGIQYTPTIISPVGLTVSSQLIVPTTKANNNITVICIVLDSLFNPQSSNPVKLYLQGAAYIICIHVFL